jgi:methylase of polypeptide subunit release factors
VDINPNSVKICRLRLWIELLKNAYYKNATELETLPNIDININCGNSLVSRFAIDSDLKQALKKSKWTIDSYRIAVETYRNAESKEQKREMERLISDIKSDFRSEISLNDPKLTKLRKLSGELFQMTQQTQLFEMSKKEKADWNKKVLKLTEETKKLENEIEEIKANKIFENAFEWRFEFPEVLNDDGDFVGFDVVIGNPPYMRVQEIQATQPSQKIYYETQYQNAKAAYDLANLFFELAINISNTKAHNSFILPHKFFNSASSEVFRNYLIAGKFIDKVAHFGANMVFEDADTYTCIAWFSKHQNKGFDFQQFPFKSDFQNLMTKNENYSLMSYEMINKASQLYGSNQWIMFNSELGFNIFEKIYRQNSSIKNKFERVSQGIATGKDEIYLFEGIEENDVVIGKFIKDPLERRIEKGIMKTFLKGKDVQRFSSPVKSLFILFPYNVNSQGKAKIMDEKEIQDNYPNAYEWLKETEEVHRKKDNKSTNDNFWYRYARNQGVDYVELPKISSMEICANHPNVIYNQENFYHPTTVYSWYKKEVTEESYEYLLAIANSKLLWWFLKTTGDTLQGDARRFKTNYLNPFPLPITVDREIENSISENVKMVMQQKKLNAKANTTEIEKEIDHLVYQLYKLTADEICTIENI